MANWGSRCKSNQRRRAIAVGGAFSSCYSAADLAGAAREKEVVVQTKTKWVCGILGIFLGLGMGWIVFSSSPAVQAGNDRQEDYVLCTGPVFAGPVGTELDGVWLLDYRAGKLLGTIINRQNGKVSGWSEVDLVSEFAIPPRTNVHFMMTTGQVGKGQAALYIAETTTGKFGVYSMVAPDGGIRGNIVIQRHDMVPFRLGNRPAAANTNQ
jgi:hypothetical protein